MNQLQQNPDPTFIERALKPPHLYASFALILLGMVSAVTVANYLNTSATSTGAQPAAAAQPSNAFDGMALEAKSAIVYDLSTGKTLYENNADAQLPPASITKVMLTLAVAEVLSPETVITIPYDTAPPGSAKRLGAGEKWKVKDVVTFTLVASSNRGADILAGAADAALHAKYPQSPDHATLWRMNDLAHELGMQHTYFLNDNGLDLSSTQAGSYSSARDIVKMMAYAATSSPQLFAGTAEGGLRLIDENGTATTAAINTNKALGDIPGLIMGKTGYTDLAGGNLAVVFDTGLAHPLIAVVMGSTEEGRFTDMKTLVTRARAAVQQE